MSDFLEPLPRQCNACSATEGDQIVKLGRCKGCRTHYYCDEDCQLNNWTDHKPICRHGRMMELTQGREPRRWLEVCLLCLERGYVDKTLT